MNIRFPKAKDAIAAFLDIRIAAYITGYIDNLAFVCGGWIDRGISMPEITIPLNNKIGFGYQGVNDKLAADNVLLLKFNPKFLKQLTACHFKGTWRRDGVLVNYSPVRIFGVCLVIPAGHRAILYRNIHHPDATPSNIVRLSASYTRIKCAASIDPACGRLGQFLCLWGILPFVHAFIRAESCSLYSPTIKGLSAPVAGKCTTGVTSSCKVREWGKDLITFFANLRILIIFYFSHTIIIPSRVGVSK